MPEGSPVPGTFLASLDQAERDALSELGLRRSFPRGGVVMFQQEPDDRVMVLLSGRVKVARADESGRELVLSIRDPGDVLGELAFISGEPRIATVTALEPLEALVMPGERISDAPRDDARCRREVARSGCPSLS